MFKLYEWINDNEIIKHINKHVVDFNNEEFQLWEKEFDPKYDEMVKNYNQCKEFSALFKKYEGKPIEVINNENVKYIYKSKGYYSCNAKRLNDNLTACLSFRPNDNNKRLHIVSCFFKNNIVLDSMLISVALYLSKHKVDNIKCVLKDMKWANERNLNEAIKYAFEDCYNDTENIVIVRRFMYKYLQLQYNYMKSSKKHSKEEYEHYYFLLERLSKLENIDLTIENKEYSYKQLENIFYSLKNKKEKISKLANSIDNVEGFEYEYALLDLCIYAICNSFDEKHSSIAKQLVDAGLLD